MTIQESINRKPIGVAIVGLGFGEAVHLPALKANPQFNPISLWHPRFKLLEEVSNRHQIGLHENWDSLLNDSSIKAIIIATPPEPRFTLAYEALEAGKHLLLEKPVAMNALEIARLQRIAIQNKLTVAVDFEYRAVPLFMQAKKLISQGLIGDPWLVKLDWLMSSRANQSRPWNWYSQAEKGGGVLGALGTHAFDILHWLLGPSKTINGQISTSIKERIEPISGKQREVTSEDIVLAQLQIAKLDSDISIPTQITLSAVTRQGRGCWLEVYGSKGTLILGSKNQNDYVHGFELWLTQIGQEPKSINPDKEFKFDKTWSDGRIAPVARVQSWWAESIYSGEPMIPGLAEAFTSQKVCDRIRESDESGQRLSN